MRIKVLVHPAEEGGYWAEVPALPGCVSEGDTLDEVLANICEAAEGWVEVAAEPASDTRSTDLDAIGRARIAVAKKLRDTSMALWQGGETSLAEYLAVQKHYDEVLAEVMAKTDADRIQYLERLVAGLKQLEDRARKLHTSGMISERDILTAELARLDAEYALAKAKLKAGTGSK